MTDKPLYNFRIAPEALWLIFNTVIGTALVELLLQVTQVAGGRRVRQLADVGRGLRVRPRCVPSSVPSSAAATGIEWQHCPAGRGTRASPPIRLTVARGRHESASRGHGARHERPEVPVCRGRAEVGQRPGRDPCVVRRPRGPRGSRRPLCRGIGRLRGPRHPLGAQGRGVLRLPVRHPLGRSHELRGIRASPPRPTSSISPTTSRRTSGCAKRSSASPRSCTITGRCSATTPSGCSSKLAVCTSSKPCRPSTCSASRPTS